MRASALGSLGALIAAATLSCLPASASTRAGASPPDGGDATGTAVSPEPGQEKVDPGSEPPASEAPPLPERLDELLAAKFLSDAAVGVSVTELPGRRKVYENNSAAPLNPASNIKLVTTAAALSLLGPEHRYRTYVYIDKDSLRDGVVRGNMYLKGGGDPQLVTANLYELATTLKTKGVKRITGKLVIDSSRFDGDGLPPGFDQKEEFASYRAPTGATSVNFNTFVLRVRPGGAVDQPAVAVVDPPVRLVQIENQAMTVAGRRNRITIARLEAPGATGVTLTGSIGVDSRGGTYRYPVAEPSRYVADVFRLVLTQAGIRVARRPAKYAATPPDAERLAIHKSDQLSVHIRAVNKLSNNFMAEQILRTLADGDGATAEAALQRVREYALGLGMPEAGFRMDNGSGLYDNNRITAAQLTHVLATVHADFRYRAEYLSSLAMMGVDGTTRSRLKDSEAARWIRAKTGTLDGVSCLSGYVGSSSGRVFAFSILMNDLRKRDKNRARALQNRIVEQLAIEVAQPKP